MICEFLHYVVYDLNGKIRNLRGFFPISDFSFVLWNMKIGSFKFNPEMRKPHQQENAFEILRQISKFTRVIPNKRDQMITIGKQAKQMITMHA